MVGLAGQGRWVELLLALVLWSGSKTTRSYGFHSPRLSRSGSRLSASLDIQNARETMGNVIFSPQISTRNTTDNVNDYGRMTLQLTRLITVPNPSYVQILKDRILSITSFSLLRKGTIMQYDLMGNDKDTGKSSVLKGSTFNAPSSPRILHGDYLWPNELSQFIDQSGHTITLVPDGFLLPGQNDGGLYAIRSPSPSHSPPGSVKPQLSQSRPIRITRSKPGWFHHKAVHVRLPGERGREGILTARARKPLFGRGTGELVWLAMPSVETDNAWHSSISVAEGDDDSHDDHLRKLDIDTALEAPWEETVLAQGPDVMFDVVDLDQSDDTIQVIAAHFFGKKLSVHSLRAVKKAPFVEIVESQSIETVGKPYGLCLATMPSTSTSASNADVIESTSSNASRSSSQPTHVLVSTHECSYDIPSAIGMAVSALCGRYPNVVSGPGSIGSSKCSDGLNVIEPMADDKVPSMNSAGGALYAYELPSALRHGNLPSKDSLPSPAIAPSKAASADCTKDATKSASAALNISSWARKTLFKGFKVRGWGGIFSPGAPGFPYVFNMPNRPHAAPLILLAGDCTGSAYIFSPRSVSGHANQKTYGDNGDHAKASLTATAAADTNDSTMASYQLAFEIECGATVGSAAVLPVADGSGDVEVFVPSYELSKVHAFRLHEE